MEPKPAADIGVHDVHVFGRKAESAGECLPVAGDVLRGVVDGELVALPPGERGVRLHGVVVLERRDVGVVDGDGAASERGVEVTANFLGAAAGVFGRARIVGGCP